jgi:predicted nucleic acid-binding protein
VTEGVSYVDTSALLKWYIHERDSDEVAAWIEAQPVVAFSRLGWIEFRCAVNRRVRTGSLTASIAAAALQQFGDDVAAGAFTLLPLQDEQALVADALLHRLIKPLRTLDALHLASAAELPASCFATADRQLAAAAAELGLSVQLFSAAR